MADARLTLVRHPPIDRGGRCVGQTTAPLLGDVERSARTVVDALPRHPQLIHCSDLPRCHRLADAIAGQLDLVATPDRRLRELDFGAWDGLHYDEIYETDRARWDAWSGDWQNAAPPDGESLDQLTHRVDAWRRNAAQLKADVLAVSHAGVIRASWVLAGDTWERAMDRPVEHLKPYALALS